MTIDTLYWVILLLLLACLCFSLEMIILMRGHIEVLKKRLAKHESVVNRDFFIRITCGKTVRVVKNIAVIKGVPQIGCSLVNDGRDDLYDLGFRHEELEANGLTIAADPE